jgi:hypothetical protein
MATSRTACAYFFGSIRGWTISISSGLVGTAFSSCTRAVGVAGREYSDCSAPDTPPAEAAEAADKYAEFG